MIRGFKKNRFRIPVRVACVCVALGVAGFVASWYACPPPLDEAKTFPSGIVLRDMYGDILRVGLSADEQDCRPYYEADADDWIVKAVVAAEDKRFFEHGGVDVRAILRAVWQNVTNARRVSGASTLTAQTVRLIAPRPRTLRHKYTEAFRAMRLERAMSKTEILSQYLNRAPFGSNLIGIEAAAAGWFGKAPRDLSIGEAALLAGMVQSPTRFRPDRNLAAALKRREYVLARMVALGMITDTQRDAARAAPVKLRRAPRPFRHPFFCDWFLAGVDAKSGDFATGLDPRIQHIADTQIRAHAARLDCDAAVVIIDVQQAAVRALACSGDYFHPDAGQVNFATSPRSAGSTLKPFLAAMAFDSGRVTPSTTMADIPLHMGNISPANFDGTFRGLARLDEALILSLNIPFITLARDFGVSEFITLLRRLGFSTVEKDAAHYGAGIAIGNVSVRLTELANAYATLARGGEFVELQRGARDAPARRERIFSEEAAWLVSDILSGAERSEDALGHIADAALPRFAWKTGTSSNFRDAWTVVWNGDYVVAVWCGNRSGRRGTAQLVGAKTAAPAAWAVMRTIDASGVAESAVPLVRPPGIVERKICARSGMAASRRCEDIATGAAIKNVSLNTPCTWHRAGANGETIVVYPDGVSAFMRTKERTDASLKITYPANGTVFKILDGVDDQAIAVKLDGAREDENVWWFVDAVFRTAQKGNAPFVVPLTKGAHTITASTTASSTSVTITAE